MFYFDYNNFSADKKKCFIKIEKKLVYVAKHHYILFIYFFKYNNVLNII